MRSRIKATGTKILCLQYAIIMLTGHLQMLYAQETIKPFFDIPSVDSEDNITLETSLYPGQGVNPSGETLLLRQYDLKLRSTLFQLGGQEGFLLSNFHLHELDGGSSSLPSTFYKLNIGLGYRDRLENGWTFNGRGLFGSSSDRLFANTRTLEGGAIGTLSIPSGERNAWLIGLLLFYQRNRGDVSNRPLPQLAYLYFPNSHLVVTAGFPFSMVTYRPSDRLTMSMAYILIRNIHVRIDWKAIRSLHFLTGFEMDSQRYNLSEKDNRVFYYENRAYAGIAYFITWDARIEMSGGYAFDRFYFEGVDYGDRDQNRLNLDPGFFAQAALKLSF